MYGKYLLVVGNRIVDDVLSLDRKNFLDLDTSKTKSVSEKLIFQFPYSSSLKEI